MKQRAKKNLVALGLASIIAGLCTSCRWSQDSSHSVIIIAVDQLGINQVSCRADNPIQERSGIGLLCQESIRFTHAYTTSILSGPALTSVLTGQYPFQHGLRSNTRSFLSARVTTLAEVYLNNGYATSFISGGAPVLRKLNLQQGFETFDDAFTPTSTRLFRPFFESQKIFETIHAKSDSQNIFSVFYVPDLLFKDTVTQTDLGETRNLSFESQVEEFDESLFTFIQNLKSRNQWDSTMIVLVGLNSEAGNDRFNELPNTNLFSERTQVGLLIKPPQKPRDEGIHWSYDGNVNLADIGFTLLEKFATGKVDADFPVLSLNEILKSPSDERAAPDRPLLMESAWNELSSIRRAIRWDQYLFLLDEKPKVFNSFIDKLETTSLRLSEPSVRDQWDSIQKILEKKNWSLWPEAPYALIRKWQDIPQPSYERLAHRFREDKSLGLHYSRELLAQQNWDQLLRWAHGNDDNDLEIVARKNLKMESKFIFKDLCLAVLQKPTPRPADLKQCTRPVALSLLEWVLADRNESLNENSRESARKRFLRQYNLYRLDQKIAETNLALHSIWDLSQELKNRPLTLEMMLALPEMTKYRQDSLR